MKGLSFQFIIVISIFFIVLIIALLFLTSGKQYIYQAVDEAFNIFGKKT